MICNKCKWAELNESRDYFTCPICNSKFVIIRIKRRILKFIPWFEDKWLLPFEKLDEFKKEFLGEK